jgi:hypothetical protein
VPDVDQLTALWNDAVLGSLAGLTKAMYSVGRFTAVDGATATFAFPNEVHRQKCEQKRGEVEAALSTRLGTPVKLRLVVDAPGAAPPPSGSGRGADAGPDAGSPPDDYDLDGADVHDLPDAPSAPQGGIAALTDAFPGSELVEGP